VNEAFGLGWITISIFWVTASVPPGPLTVSWAVMVPDSVKYINTFEVFAVDGVPSEITHEYDVASVDVEINTIESPSHISDDDHVKLQTGAAKGSFRYCPSDV